MDNARQPVFPVGDLSTNSGLARGQYGCMAVKVLCRALRHNALVAVRPWASAVARISRSPVIGPAHRVRPLAGPMASSGGTRWLNPGYEVQGVAQWTMCHFGAARPLRR